MWKRVLLLAGLAAIAACDEDKPAPPDAGPATSAPVATALPVDSATTEPAPPPPPPPPPALKCSPEMVTVDGRFCIDRWEASLIDLRTQAAISPYYPPRRKAAVNVYEKWDKERLTIGSEDARAVPLPPLPAWQRERDPEPVAVSRGGVVPNGYLSGEMAELACKNAGKRLCRYDEWVTACEGEAKQQFPYGTKYKQGACNIFRPTHPALVLHNDPSIGHLDPRLNLVKYKGEPLLRRTGATKTCASQWGKDAIFDMNGNLDEWVEDEKGRFAGGFFSRSKKDGCQSVVGVHGRTYLDYSLGTRCCWSP